MTGSGIHRWKQNLPGQVEFYFFKLGDQMRGQAGGKTKFLKVCSKPYVVRLSEITIVRVATKINTIQLLRESPSEIFNIELCIIK